MAIMSGNNISQALIEALGLPKHTIWFEVRAHMNSVVTVRCSYYPDINQTELVSAFSEYELCRKQKDDEPN